MNRKLLKGNYPLPTDDLPVKINADQIAGMEECFIRITHAISRMADAVEAQIKMLEAINRTLDVIARDMVQR